MTRDLSYTLLYRSHQLSSQDPNLATIFRRLCERCSKRRLPHLDHSILRYIPIIQPEVFSPMPTMVHNSNTHGPMCQYDASIYCLCTNETPFIMAQTAHRETNQSPELRRASHSICLANIAVVPKAGLSAALFWSKCRRLCQTG